MHSDTAMELLETPPSYDWGRISLCKRRVLVVAASDINSVLPAICRRYPLPSFLKRIRKRDDGEELEWILLSTGDRCTPADAEKQLLEILLDADTETGDWDIIGTGAIKGAFHSVSTADRCPTDRESFQELMAGNHWPIVWRAPDWEPEGVPNVQHLRLEVLLDSAPLTASFVDCSVHAVVTHRDMIPVEITVDPPTFGFPPTVHPISTIIEQLAASVRKLTPVDDLEALALPSKRPRAGRQQGKRQACLTRDPTGVYLQASQYYGTNLTVVLWGEPCMQCAMAILHSRFSRVIIKGGDADRSFLNNSSPNAIRLHGAKKLLNHTFRVYRVL